MKAYNIVFVMFLLSLTGCQTVNEPIIHSSGAKYTIDHQNKKLNETYRSGGVGVEGRDILSLSQFMSSDLNKNIGIFGNKKPRIIIDSKYIINDSASAIDTNLLTDRLRSNLIRLMKGRASFVGRQNVKMVMKERDLKASGIVTGNVPNAGVLGADFRLTGRITTSESVNTGKGIIKRFNQINLELINLQSSEIIWSQIFSFEKEGLDNVIYR